MIGTLLINHSKVERFCVSDKVVAMDDKTSYATQVKDILLFTSGRDLMDMIIELGNSNYSRILMG